MGRQMHKKQPLVAPSLCGDIEQVFLCCDRDMHDHPQHQSAASSRQENVLKQRLTKMKRPLPYVMKIIWLLLLLLLLLCHRGCVKKM
jgi:hypothetical protein